MALIADVSKLISTWFNLNCRCQRFKKTLTISRYFLQKRESVSSCTISSKIILAAPFWDKSFCPKIGCTKSQITKIGCTNQFVPKLDAPFQIKPTWENSRGALEKLLFFWVFHAQSPFKLILVFLMHIEIFFQKNWSSLPCLP